MIWLVNVWSGIRIAEQLGLTLGFPHIRGRNGGSTASGPVRFCPAASLTLNPSCWLQIPDRVHVNAFHYSWRGLGDQTEHTKLGVSDTLASCCTCASPTTVQIMLNKTDFVSHFFWEEERHSKWSLFLLSTIVCFS